MLTYSCSCLEAYELASLYGKDGKPNDIIGDICLLIAKIMHDEIMFIVFFNFLIEFCL